MSSLMCVPPLSGFSGLSVVDQMSLLQSGWMEALLVGVAWRSQGAAGQELVFAGNLRLDEGQCRAAGLGDLYEALRHLTAKYQAMNLSPEEVVALKAMALANSGTHTQHISLRYISSQETQPNHDHFTKPNLHLQFVHFAHLSLVSCTVIYLFFFKGRCFKLSTCCKMYFKSLS